MSSLLTICLALSLLPSRLALPAEARLGTVMELRPLKLHPQWFVSPTEPWTVAGILDTLYQALTSFIDSAGTLVSTHFRQENNF